MVVLMKTIALFLMTGAALAAQNPPSKKPDRTVAVVAERFSFNPSRIRVKQGTEVELIITSEDTGHGFRLEAAGVDGQVPQQGKGAMRVRFLAKQKGHFVFECSRPCGAGHNLMRGTIVVE